MQRLISFFRKFAAEEEGVTMVEYGLIAALIAIVCIVALTGTGVSVQEAFTKICNTVKTAVGGTATCS
jgi:pilus assembly protein Flp/PilA